MDPIRIVVCGDEGVGKSSLIATLIKEEFAPHIEKVVPPVTILREDYAAAFEYETEEGVKSKRAARRAFSRAAAPPGDPPAAAKREPDLYLDSGAVYILGAIPPLTTLIDTSLSDVALLQRELKRADAIWLVYLDHYTYERVLLHWLTMFRSMGISLPIVICANKLDLPDSTSRAAHSLRQQNADEFIPLINEFKEIEACIRCSAKLNYNVSEAFYLCERAITHPISPIFDSKEGTLKPACVQALKRVFFLCDQDQDGILNYKEFARLHHKCFSARSTSIERFDKIVAAVNKRVAPAAAPAEPGISEDGFVILHKMYAERGRHETIWCVLRAFHYTNSLLLYDKFLYPLLEVPTHASVELGPIGYRFLVDLFLKFDRDNDGGLSEQELANLFTPTPGIPRLWRECQFPASIVRNDEGYVSLQGWLAQWNLTTFLDHKTTLEYLAYLGFDDYESLAVKALKVTKPRKRRLKQGKFYRQPVNDRNVFNCYILGAPKSGKTSLIELFLKGSFSETYLPTIKPRICVKDIELRGGKQCYLILEELGELEPAILENKERLNQCDVICYVYDSLDPESFQYLVDLRERYTVHGTHALGGSTSTGANLLSGLSSHLGAGETIVDNTATATDTTPTNHLDEIPSVFVALKADLDKQQQRSDFQPETYTRDLHLNSPLHILSYWPTSIHELFIQLVDAAKLPSLATPGLENEPDDSDNENLKHLVLAGGAILIMTLVLVWIWRSSLQSQRL